MSVPRSPASRSGRAASETALNDHHSLGLAKVFFLRPQLILWLRVHPLYA